MKIFFALLVVISSLTFARAQEFEAMLDGAHANPPGTNPGTGTFTLSASGPLSIAGGPLIAQVSGGNGTFTNLSGGFSNALVIDTKLSLSITQGFSREQFATSGTFETAMDQYDYNLV